MSYGNAEDASRDDGWEQIIHDPFVRSCVRGIQVWLRSLDRNEIDLWRTQSHFNVSFEPGRRPKAIYWYFHGGKTGEGYFIHFELPKATLSEISILKLKLELETVYSAAHLGSLHQLTYSSAALQTISSLPMPCQCINTP